MDKIHRERKLIGFYSRDMIAKKKKLSFTPRMFGYSSVIAVLLGVMSYFIFTRSDMDITVMRSAGMLYQEQPGGYISNVYNAEIINKANITRTVKLETANPAIKIKYIQAPGAVTKGNSVKTVFFVLIPASQIHDLKTSLQLRLVAGNRVVKTVSTTFVGPVN